MVLICISQITNNFEHLFIWLLAICVASSVSGLCKPLAIFLLSYLSFSYWYILDSNLALVICIVNIPSQCVTCLFILLKVTCNEQNFNKVQSSYLFIFLSSAFFLSIMQWIFIRPCEDDSTGSLWESKKARKRNSKAIWPRPHMHKRP